MKTNIIKLLTVAIAIAASAFTTLKAPVSKSEMNKRVNQTWYFQSGHELGDAIDDANWSTSPQQSCDNANQVPCQVDFEADDYQMPSTNTPLQNYLDAQGSATSIRANATSRRTE
ncbi:hypothetical protein ABDD95_12660 [Mucilaginibacter sp. PAMB04274]|uniref:hypothetical protein n=1 Tax=Mucilaginibacter sp. PAMB04274 TaxID=3138568 RepID=UPI0031F67CD4